MRTRSVLFLVVPFALLAGATGAGGGVRLSPADAVRMHKTCLVPNVKKKTVGAAERAIRRHHCSVGAIRRVFSTIVTAGRVVSQQPSAGARRPARSRVSLLVSKGAALASAGTVVKRISVPNAPHGLLALPGAVWVAAHRGEWVYRIDTPSNKVVANVVVTQAGGDPARMTFGDGILFAVNYSGDAVNLIDPATNTLASVIHAPFENCCFPAYGAGSLWLMGLSSSGASSPDRLMRLDSAGHVLMTMKLSNAIGLAFGAGSVWGSASGQVFRLDPSTDQIVAHIPTDAAPMTFGAGAVWGLSAKDGRKLVRIDPAANSVSATIELPATGGLVTATDSAVWVTEGGDTPGSHVWKIDPTTNRVVGQVNLGLRSALGDVAVGDGGDVWVSAFDSNQVLRIHPTG